MKNEEQILTVFSPAGDSSALRNFINQAGDLVIRELGLSFARSGHKMTGKLIEDITTEAELYVAGFAINYIAYKYGAYLNFGVPASRIPFTPHSGAKHSLYIEGLKKYVRLRMGISDPRKQLSIAFAIAHEQKKRGMPLRTSGRGTQWIDKTKDEIDNGLTVLFNELSETYIVRSIQEIANKYNTRS